LGIGPLGWSTLHQKGTTFSAILPLFMKDLASWADEGHFCLVFCRSRIFYRQKELSAFFTKFLQGVMFDITLRANDHFSLLKSPFPEPLGVVIMHFMCHRINKFLPSDFNVFSDHLKNELNKIAECGQKLSMSPLLLPSKFLDFV